MKKSKYSHIPAMKTYLVTGGAGFIGSHIIRELLNKGNKVVCLDDFDEYYDVRIKRENMRPLLKNANHTLYNNDVRSAECLRAIFFHHDVDTVIHLAARPGVRGSISNAELYYDVNVTGTLTLLEAMRTHNVKRMIFASSSSVYGDNKGQLEEHFKTDKVISPYAATKLAGEQLCSVYHELHGMDIFCLRLFTVYGDRQRPDMAIGKFINNIRNNIPVTLYGDGKTTRDYTYIKDIVRGILLSCEKLKGYEVINLGSTRRVTLHELIYTLEQVLKCKATIKYEDMQPGDVYSTYADIRKARLLLGYEPTYSLSLRECLMDYV